MERTIVSLINNDVDVDAILNKRFFPVRIPQSNKTFPAATFRRMGTSPTDSKDGASSLDTHKLMIDLWGNSYSELKDLAKKIRAAIDRKSVSLFGIDVDSIIFVNDKDGFSDNTDLNHLMQEYKIREKL